MRTSKFTTILLGLNAMALLGVLVVLLARLGDPSPVAPEASLVRPLPVAARAPETPIVTVVQTNEFHWQQLESEDYRTYIARLRSIGCPEQTIRDLIIADVDKLLAPRLQATVPRRKELKYWQPEEQELWYDFDAREGLKQQKEIDYQKREVIRELMGVDLVGERLKQQGQEDYYGRRLSFLPEEKRGEIRTIMDKFSDQELALREKQWEEGEALTAEDQAELGRIQTQRQAEILKLLSPAEREQFDLWMSSTANSVRSSLYGMNATEEEFQSLYKLRKTFDEAWNSGGIDLNDEFTRDKLEQANARLDAQIKQQLGEDRYAEYKRGQDPDYHQMSRTATRFKLPKETANQLYDVKRTVLEERARVSGNPSLTPEQREATLQAIAQETAGAVRSTLGERAFNFYQRQGQAAWIGH